MAQKFLEQRVLVRQQVLPLVLQLWGERREVGLDYPRENSLLEARGPGHLLKQKELPM
jgi:hypothetical protein